jgi:sialate O-acetylesterase
MVLQIDDVGLPPVKIFGLAYTNETIVVEGSAGFPGPFTLIPITTGAGHWLPPGEPWGNWSVSFPAPHHRGPYSLTVRSVQNKSDSTTYTNVMFGQVFFCAGQSNMKLTVSATDDAAAEYAAASALNDQIRINFVSGNLSLDGPQTSPTTGNWTVGGAQQGLAIKDFSAICWAHGRLLTEWLNTNTSTAGTTVGLVEISVGGTTIHHWIPSYAGIECNRTGLLPNKGECVQYPPGWIYNGRMNPILLDGGGFSARLALYYQGEADSGENDKYTEAAYACELTGLVNSWRRAFAQPNMPIIVIELPGAGGTTSFQHDNDTAKGSATAQGWQAVQMAQQRVAEAMSAVGLVPVYGARFKRNLRCSL